jgi:hypothetical protein
VAVVALRGLMGSTSLFNIELIELGIPFISATSIKIRGSFGKAGWKKA